MQWRRPGGVRTPTAARPLVAEGRRYPVGSALLLQIPASEVPAAGDGRPSAGRLALELLVDGRPADDGELSPTIAIDVDGDSCPPLRELVGQRLDRLGTATGRFGPRAPRLEDIEITLVDLTQPGAAVLRIRATYRWEPGRPLRHLAFAGPVRLAASVTT